MKTIFFRLCTLILAAAASLTFAENGKVSDRDLFRAVQRNNLERFQDYLAGNANWQALDRRGNTLIHALIAPEMIDFPEYESPPGGGGGAAVAKLKRNAVHPISVQMPRSHSGTTKSPLQLRMDIVRSLVGHGVDINQKNDKGETPLMMAVRARGFSVAFSTFALNPDGYLQKEPDPALFMSFLRFLLHLKANPRLPDARGQTPLFEATAEMIPLLLAHGATFEDRDQNGMTPFLAADPKKALTLLKLGADAQAADNRKRNRWHYLDFADWEELAQKLIELRVDINQRDVNGRTPLLLNCKTEKLKLALFLLEHGADPDLAEKDGDTPLHHAASAGNLELLEWLMRNGAAVNVRNRNGQTPLYYARFNEKTAELLLHYKADPNIPDIAGNTILHLLVANGSKKAIESLAFFVRHGAAIDRKDGMGETPLGKALYKENLAAMNVLLENGADPNVSGARGWSLLDRAEIKKRPDVLSLLRKYGARHQRSLLDRYKLEIYYGCIFLGIIPLFTFLFSLHKPSPFTKRLLWFFLVPGGFGLLMIIGYFSGGFSSGGGEGFLVLILAMPPLTTLLMSLAGTRMLADRSSPGLGIPLSFFNAAGCMGLTLGIVFLFLPGTHGEGGILLAYDAIFGGGAAAVITLIFAFVVWKRRLAPSKKADSASRELGDSH